MNESNEKKLELILETIGQMASLNFTNEIETDDSDDRINAVAQGLNWLSEELQNHMVEKSRLEEINQSLEKFATIAAHDMKSPLNSAWGLISMIEDDLEDSTNPELKRYIELLKVTNIRARQLIDGILKYSRASDTSMKFQNVDLGKLSSNLAAEYSSNKPVQISLPTNNIVVRHNETALSQVIGNLISNAIKHNDKEKCKIEIEWTDKGDHYEVSVSDNGPGIPENARKKIFDLFENLRSKKENSTGIGLSVVKKIIRQTHNRVWVDPAKGGGAKFIFTISKEIGFVE